MISLRLLLLVLLTLGCREWAAADRQADGLRSAVAALGVVLGWALLHKMAVLRILSSFDARACPRDASSLAGRLRQRCSQVRSRLEVGWLLVLPLAVVATGWGPSLNSWEQSGLPQAVALVGWFLPSLMLVAGLELTAAQCDGLLDEVTSGDGPPSGDGDSSWGSIWRLRLRLGDMAGLLTCLVPVLLIAATSDAWHLLAVPPTAFDHSPPASGQTTGATHILPPPRSTPAGGWHQSDAAGGWHQSDARAGGGWHQSDEVGIGVLVASGVGLGAAVLCFPLWLGRWMGARPLPAGPLRQRIELQLAALRLRGITPRLMPSQGRWPGAAIVGWVPRFRQLWLGDALVERLTPRQLDMVVMHELAHVTGRHYLWRTAPLLAGAAVLGLFQTYWPASGEWQWAGKFLGGCLASGLMLLGMSLMAHQCELDADRAACDLATTACPWADQQPQRARVELAAALLQLSGACPQAAAASWLHPSLAVRLRNLRRS